MKNGRREKRNETDTSRGMEKKKVVGEPQVEERVEGWDWRRLLEPPRVYLICERLPPPRVSITPVRTWPCHATTRPTPSHPVIESREDRCDSSLSHQLTRTQSLTPHFLLRSAPTMSTSRHPFSNQSKNRPTDSLARSEETSRVKFPPLEILKNFFEEGINFWDGISFSRKLLHRCQRLR